MKYKVCTNCVMDSSDTAISFDDKGVCDHCRDFHNTVAPNWFPNEIGEKKLSKLVSEIKLKGKGKDFDCILGLSGGLDSSYMLHILVKTYGLRPLVFHVDGGWNSELAVANIQSLVDKLGLDLFTEVIDWEDMRDFQLAWFKSGTPILDLPQDHAFVATLYKFAAKYDIKYIINGGNISTECVRNPLEWFYYGTDMFLINDIRKRFCTRQLKNYPFSSIFNHKIYLPYVRRIKVVKPLNLIPYNKKLAIDTLVKEYDWNSYPQKHFESRFTKFYEGFWLPTRFGYDTRKVQFSSLILTGQMMREEAIELLSKPSYDVRKIDDEFSYIAKKLDITIDELWHYHSMPKKSYRDFRNQEAIFNLGAKILKMFGVETSVKR